MEEYFLYLVNNFSLETFLMSLGVFGATMLIKIPIKKVTSTMDETKRQGLNSLIILIPLVMSFLVAIGYFLIQDRPILSYSYITYSLSICIMAITIYLIYARIGIIFKGIFSVITSNKTSDNGTTAQYKAELEEITKQLTALMALKQKLESNEGVQNIIAITETNNQITKLQDKKQEIIALTKRK